MCDVPGRSPDVNAILLTIGVLGCGVLGLVNGASPFLIIGVSAWEDLIFLAVVLAPMSVLSVVPAAGVACAAQAVYERQRTDEVLVWVPLGGGYLGGLLSGAAVALSFLLQ